MNGFLFPESEIAETKTPPNYLPSCGKCGLNKTCANPVMPVDGQGQRKILVIGEAPGETEDEQNKPFVGDAGRLLTGTLRKFGVDLRRDCWITNAAACRPPKNELPEKAIDYCRPLVIQAIKQYQPGVIILLGASAVKSVIGWLWKEDTGGVGRWVGWKIPCQQLNAWVCPTWHPSAVQRGQNNRAEPEGVVRQKQFESHLKVACGLEGRPWGKLPDYRSKIRLAFDPGEAAYYLLCLQKAGSTFAFDFETDRLKPDHPESYIACCSVSDGRTSVAFPWQGSAVKVMKELLTSDMPKIGYNAKFEDRWCRQKLGIRVRNWVFDGMLAAHVLDNRPGTKGLKFQSFVRLGMESYNDYVGPFMEGEGGNGPNRIKELDKEALMRYCALDSLLEFKVAKQMSKELGLEL